MEVRKYCFYEEFVKEGLVDEYNVNECFFYNCDRCFLGFDLLPTKSKKEDYYKKRPKECVTKCGDRITHKIGV